jgi:hypothetical protein
MPAPNDVRQTNTFAELELSQTAYDEIRKKLEAAGYHHAFMFKGTADGEAPTIDMHGIGVTRASGAEEPKGFSLSNCSGLPVEVSTVVEKLHPGAVRMHPLPDGDTIVAAVELQRVMIVAPVGSAVMYLNGEIRIKPNWPAS